MEYVKGGSRPGMDKLMLEGRRYKEEYLLSRNYIFKKVHQISKSKSFLVSEIRNDDA